MFITNAVIYIFKPVVMKGLIMGNLLAFTIPIIVGIFKVYRIEIYIEKIKLLNMELDQKANYNHLTGLFNRRKFFELSESVIGLSKRYNHSIAFCIFDVDDFKKINDTEGHIEGDWILKAISEILKTNLRKTDLTGRFGGDEFCIMLPETEKDQAENVIEKIREEITSLKTGEGTNVTCSFGLVSCSGAGIPDMDSLLSAADNFLYSAKRNGKNRLESGDLNTL